MMISVPRRTSFSAIGSEVTLPRLKSNGEVDRFGFDRFHGCEGRR